MLSLDFLRLREAYRDGATTPEKVIEEILTRIEAAGESNVWISRPGLDALRNQARELTRLRPDDPRLPFMDCHSRLRTVST